mgnify:CR=1 FL=1
MIGLIFFYTLSNPPIAPPLGSPTERPADPTASSPLAALIDLFAEGEKKYLAGDYVGALTVFGRAYEQSQDPTCLANMARIHEDLGEYDQAAELYRRFLRHPLASPTDRDTIARRLDRLPVAAPTQPLVLEPPPPILAAPPAPTQAAPTPEAAPPARLQIVPPVQPPRSRPLLISGGVAIGLSVPAIAVSALYLDRARQLQASLAETAYPSHDERMAASQRGREAQWIAIGTATAGGALFVSGVVLTAIGSKRARAAARVLQRAAPGLVLRF